MVCSYHASWLQAVLTFSFILLAVPPISLTPILACGILVVVSVIVRAAVRSPSRVWEVIPTFTLLGQSITRVLDAIDVPVPDGVVVGRVT